MVYLRPFHSKLLALLITENTDATPEVAAAAHKLVGFSLHICEMEPAFHCISVKLRLLFTA
jgi:hypothetical protein